MAEDQTSVVSSELSESTPLLVKMPNSSKSPSYCPESGSSSISSTLSSTTTISGITKRICCDYRLLGIIFLLIGGSTIATYLLILENRFRTTGFVLDFVNHEVWSKIPISVNNNVLNNTNVLHVLILQTGGTECKDIETCVNLLREMQKSEQLESNAEIPYNFLISADGQTFEIRGWDYESGFHYLPKQTSLVIGFIGNYTYKSPSAEQLKSALSLIIESQRQQKLHNDFQIYGVRNLTVSHRDGEALFSHVSQWHQFDTLFKVL